MNRLGGFILIILGVVVLLVSGFFVWGRIQAEFTRQAVSYTHLTLPTMYTV